MLGTMAGTSASISDTLTFLFTDLEGSTRTWEREPEAMDRWLTAHDGILTAAINANHGRVFKHTGDGMCAVFAAPADAAGAALAVQSALATAGAAVVGPLRVRIALHTGEARERGGDFYGPSLNRCARLLEIAHGGQVLLSASAASLVGEGLSLVDLGQHRLRDLQQYERVWQLGGLRGDFPPLRSLDAFAHNLPVQRSSFVGRDAEKRVLEDLLETSRMVTITGVGGCGKTRLTLEVAAQVVDRFADGAFLVDLASQMEQALVPSTIIAALGMPAGAGSAESR